ncbi:unnamed protein product [Caenorhabditis angaria]|uniref:Uncharacterized protein n=1 Tax=Caenorhabditis angaria TaxID=860376 RepID=A0A9P1IRT1_9PELO|nr:unnamed protein product [Caenorhabditis angaria]
MSSHSPILEESNSNPSCETPLTKCILEPHEPPVMKSRDWWNRTCDFFGAREAAFINELRPLRVDFIRMQEALKIFHYELERDLETQTSSTFCYRLVKNCILRLNRICAKSTFNIPPKENETIRNVAYELAILARIIQEVVHFSKNEEEANIFKKSATRTSEENLKNKIRTIENIVENFIKYIDKKTERRWWLRDLISFLHVLVRIALFVSAGISVAYHNNQAAPIVTLVITCIQGTIEALDQFFIRKKFGNEVQITIIGPKTPNLH